MSTFVQRLAQLRSPFLVALAISLGGYFYHLAQAPIGNHDWPRMGGLPWFDYQIRLGRWFTPVVYALTGFRQLPVLNAFFAIVAYVASGFATALLVEDVFNRRLTNRVLVIVSSLIALIPFSTWTFYFSWQAAVGPVASLLAVCGVWLVARQPSWSRAGLGGVLICWSMASYQSAINTAAVLFWLVAIAWVSVETRFTVRQTVRRLSMLAGSITFGAVLYKISLWVLDDLGVLKDSYHFKTIGLQELPTRIVSITEVAFEHLLKAQPFFPVWLKLLLLLLSLVGVGTLVRDCMRSGSSRLFRVAFLVVALLFMVFSTKVQFLVVENQAYYRYRFAAFGLTFLYAPLMMLGARDGVRWLPHLQSLLAMIAVWSCTVQNLMWQDSQVKQNARDTRVLERVIMRIEELPGFSYNRHYNLIQVGNLPDSRATVFDYEGEPSPEHLYTLLPSWAPKGPYRGLEPRLKLDDAFLLKRAPKDFDRKRLRELRSYVQKAQPWPHPTSVALLDREIVVILEK